MIRHVLALAAQVGLVYLDGSAKQPLAPLPGLADAMRQVPSRFLRDVQVPVQLHAGVSLQIRCQHVSRDHPFLRAEVRVLHDRAGAHREELAALPAAIAHVRMLRPALDVRGFAMRAGRPVRPANRGNPILRGLIVWE